MCCFRQIAIAIVVPLLSITAGAADTILGFGGAADTADGRSAVILGDFAVNDANWLSATVAYSSTGGYSGGIHTWTMDVGIDHWFDPIGIQLGAGYWGDQNLLDSNDLRASVYARNKTMSISANYERHDFDLTIGNNLLPLTRTIEFYSNGYGLATRLNTSEKTSLSLNAIYYDYSRNINLQPNINVLRLFSMSRLGLMNSLLDYHVGGAINWDIGQRSIGLSVERWQTAIDKALVNSVGVGLLTPMGDRGDMEFRLTYDRSDDFGGTVAFSAFFYFFGS